MTEKSTFARRVRAARPRDKRYDVADDVIQGLCLRVSPSGVRTFALSRMVRGRRRYATIGSADAMTIPEARREARRLIASYIEPAKTDNGPRMPGHPMNAFAEEFLDRQAHRWKPRTLECNAHVVRKDILPAFGRMPLDAIGPAEVAAWFDEASKDKPGAANRAFEILRAMINRAEEWGLRERGSNPCLGIAKNPRNNVARFLDTDELARLGRALDANEARWPEAVAAIRLLALTGCRRSEVLNLRWRNIEANALNLEDSKTGPRAAPLGEAARRLVETLPGPGKPEAFLLPSFAHGKGYYPLRNCWRAVCADAGFDRLRLHDLRHTAASQAVSFFVVG